MDETLLRSKRWAYIAVLCGAAPQIFGWLERYLASDGIQLIEQLAVLTLAPTLRCFADYLVYGMTDSLLSMLAASQQPNLLPWMSPRKYMWSFIAIDSVTLVIQAIGGAIAAITDDMFSRLRKVHSDPVSLSTGSGKVFRGIRLMAFLIMLRGLYRSAELAVGLFGSIATKRVALICCNAISIFIVIFGHNLTRPLHTINSLLQPDATQDYSLDNVTKRGADGSDDKILSSGYDMHRDVQQV
ncbi:hypothetical protein JCM11641_000113 [Rhodosporidiobolus odoratus]